MSIVSGLILPDAARAGVTAPEPGMKREILVSSAAMTLVRHRMVQGWRGTAHSHPHEQMVYIVSGSIEVNVGGTSHRVQAGDSFIVASNVVHQATALEDSVVLDIFTPAREEYL